MNLGNCFTGFALFISYIQSSNDSKNSTNDESDTRQLRVPKFSTQIFFDN